MFTTGRDLAEHNGFISADKGNAKASLYFQPSTPSILLFNPTSEEDLLEKIVAEAKTLFETLVENSRQYLSTNELTQWLQKDFRDFCQNICFYAPIYIAANPALAAYLPHLPKDPAQLPKGFNSLQEIWIKQWEHIRHYSSSDYELFAHHLGLGLKSENRYPIDGHVLTEDDFGLLQLLLKQATDVGPEQNGFYTAAQHLKFIHLSIKLMDIQRMFYCLPQTAERYRSSKDLARKRTVLQQLKIESSLTTFDNLQKAVQQLLQVMAPEMTPAFHWDIEQQFKQLRDDLNHWIEEIQIPPFKNFKKDFQSIRKKIYNFNNCRRIYLLKDLVMDNTQNGLVKGQIAELPVSFGPTSIPIISPTETLPSAPPIALTPSVKPPAALSLLISQFNHDEDRLVQAIADDAKALWTEFSTKVKVNILWLYHLPETLQKTFAQCHQARNREDKEQAFKKLNETINKCYVQTLWSACSEPNFTRQLTEWYTKFVRLINQVCPKNNRTSHMSDLTHAPTFFPQPLKNDGEGVVAARVMVSFKRESDEVEAVAARIMIDCGERRVPLFRPETSLFDGGSRQRFYINKQVVTQWKREASVSSGNSNLLKKTNPFNFFPSQQPSPYYVDYCANQNLYIVPHADRKLINAALRLIKENPKYKQMVDLSEIKNREWRKIAIEETLQLGLRPVGIPTEEVQQCNMIATKNAQKENRVTMEPLPLAASPLSPLTPNALPVCSTG